MNPWPSAYTFYRGKQLKIWKAVPVPNEEGEKAKSGCVLKLAKDSFDVACADGAIRILELQLEGKKRMSTHDFLLGVKPEIGEKLGR